MRTLLAIPRTLATLLVGLVATGIASGAIVLMRGRDPSSKVFDRIIQAWSNAWLTAAGCKMEVSGVDRIDPSRSYVVVANHLSNLDVMVCFKAIPLPIRYLAKKELFSIPLLASAMRILGIVEVDRSARGALIDSVTAQSHKVIEAGHSLIIHPEGTRSDTGRLQSFKKGAFAMANDTGMAVVPVTIHGTWEMWRPGSKTIRPGRVEVIIDSPLPQTLSVEETRERARAIIAGRLAELEGAARTAQS